MAALASAKKSKEMQVVDKLPKRSGLFIGRGGEYFVQPSTKRTTFSETSQLKETLIRELRLKHSPNFIGTTISAKNLSFQFKDKQLQKLLEKLERSSSITI